MKLPYHTPVVRYFGSDGPHVPRNLKYKKKTPKYLKVRKRNMEKTALKTYQKAIGMKPERVSNPQTTKEICQDALGIVEDAAENGMNDNHYLELSNHLMSLHKRIKETSNIRDENFYIDRNGDRNGERNGDWETVHTAHTYRRSLYSTMATSELLYQFTETARLTDRVDVDVD